MNTGQVLFVIFAFVLLSALALNFNMTSALSVDAVHYAQDGILLTTVAASYEELARGLAFDARTDTGHIVPSNLGALTPAGALGPEDSSETHITGMNDVDDFNGLSFEREITGSGKRFRSSFRVFYVRPTDVSVVSASPTLVKRMVIRTWQSYPPVSSSSPADTLVSQALFGYFHFQ